VSTTVASTEQSVPESAEVKRKEWGALLPRDRCDYCGHQAFVRVIHTRSEKDLLFCNHHFRQHEATFASLGWDVIDESHRINERP
jgi:hypothetical protein